jgi:hypothetical protein
LQKKANPNNESKKLNAWITLQAWPLGVHSNPSAKMKRFGKNNHGKIVKLVMIKIKNLAKNMSVLKFSQQRQ